MNGECHKEKAAVKSILESGEMTMSQIVKDRVEIMYKLNERGQSTTVFVEMEE